MSDKKSPKTGESVATPDDAAASPTSDKSDQAKEVGGRDGLDPTRFGDWEKNGRCIDF